VPKPAALPGHGEEPEAEPLASDPEPEPAAEPTPEPERAEEPAESSKAGEGFGAPQLRLVLSGSLVVVIVLVIMFLSWRRSRDPLRHVPEDCAWVTVTHMDRFLASPIYDALGEAEHPISLELKAFETTHDVRLKDDVQVVAEVEGATILMGKFLQRRMRSALAVRAEAKARELGLSDDALPVEEGEVEGLPFLFISKTVGSRVVDHALAWRGNSIVCAGRRDEVRRFLALAARRCDDILANDALAAAYDKLAAREALVFRLAKPSDCLLLHALASRAVEGAGVRACFTTLGCTDEAVALSVTLLAKDEAAAGELEAWLATPEAAKALTTGIGCTEGPTVAREGDRIVVAATVPMERFRTLVALDKEAGGGARPGGLILRLLD